MNRRSFMVGSGAMLGTVAVTGVLPFPTHSAAKGESRGENSRAQ
jgi:hypothetical protein